MPATSTICNTPQYLLMNGKQRMAPDVVPLSTGIDCLPVYGFSDKSRYDAFCRNSKLPLVPYPLVKLFLREQTQTPGDCLRLIVIDAAGPDEACINAATMKAVLVARESSANHVDAEYQLIRDSDVDGYRVKETPR